MVQEMYPKRKKIPPKPVISHVDKSLKSYPIFEEKNPENNLIAEEFEGGSENGAVEVQIEEILKIGEELFASGSYLEVITHFDQAAATFQKYGYEIEAHIFYKKANELRSLIAERAGKLTLLEQAKICKNLTNILALYKDIMEISRKLNDFDGLKVFQSELHQIIMMNNRFQSGEADKRLEIPRNQIDFQENPIHSPVSFSFYNELQKFAIDDLIVKRNHLEENAKKMEQWLLLKSAVIFYEKCEEISLQLVHLGKTEERIKVENYRSKKLECLKKNSLENTSIIQ